MTEASQRAVSQVDGRVQVRLQDDVEEAAFVYDLIQAKRLVSEQKDALPLPFRGQFLFKLPSKPRPVGIQVARVEATAEEVLAGGPGVQILVHIPQGALELVDELEVALREVPPASEEEFKERTSGDEFARVRAMNHAQRVIYATRAGQTGRAVLLQQPNPLILLYLVKNPLITLPEIVQVARLPSIDSLVAEYIVKLMRGNPSWAMSDELKMALVMNPKTPGGTALSLLRALNSKNLRHLCKQGDVRSNLKQAAIRMLTERKE